MNKEAIETLVPGEGAGVIEKLVWVATEKGDYQMGKVLTEDDTKLLVEIEGSRVTVLSREIEKANPSKFDLVDNMAHLSYLNEPSILHNLKQRYLVDQQYTYSGLFLVAVNPYKNIPIYSRDFVDRYAAVYKRDEAPPHIYAVASESYHHMRQTKRAQTILITGESGAGKTENTKHAINFLTKISGEVGQGMKILEERLLWANPLLEAFGNARTERNDNSSRFGKFIRIDFGVSGEIVGASVERYLLEASRVTKQTKGERNYHVFYTLVKGGDSELLDSLKLAANKSYKIIPAVEGAITPFSSIMGAMSILGVSEEQKTKIFRILAAIIHLGEVAFLQERKEVVLTEDGGKALDHASQLLGVAGTEFLETLVRPRIRAGNEIVTHGRTAEEANFTVTSLCKVLYDRLFDWIVALVNKALQGTTPVWSYIGVLDIAGFEILESNGFEQLCINYTNEKLQQFFNHRMFILEQETYLKEGLEWNMIDFGLDLQPTIDLLEMGGVGLFTILDEECVVPGGSDSRFLEKISSKWNSHESLSVPRFNDGFVINHYAGAVKYTKAGWISKNKDPLDEAIATFLLGPRGPIPHLESARDISATRFRTVIQRHKKQLCDLLGLLHTTDPHFVRCIIPNTEKRAGCFDSVRVLHQLRCNGVLEGVRISRQGFPTRVTFQDFHSRYGLLDRNKAPGTKIVDASAKDVTALLGKLEVPASLFKLGRSLLFLRQGVLADLEEHRNVQLSRLVHEVQKKARILLNANKERLDREREEAVMLLQRNIRSFVAVRQWSWWKLCMKVRPLLAVRKTEEELNRKDLVISTLRDEVYSLTEALKTAQLESASALHELRKALTSLDEHRQASSFEVSALQEESTATRRELELTQKASTKSLAVIESLKKDLLQAQKRAEQARKDAASENSAKLLTEIGALKERIQVLEKTAQTLQQSLNHTTAALDASEHEKEIYLRERHLAEERGKRLQTEVEELQNSLKTAETLKYKSELALKTMQGETARLTASLSFEKEKRAKLDEAFKRATAPTPAPAAPAVKDNTAEMEQLKRELAEEKEERASVKCALDETKAQYFELLDGKLGAMLTLQDELKSSNALLKCSLDRTTIKLEEERSAAAEAHRAREEALAAKSEEAAKRKQLEDLLAAKKASDKERDRSTAKIAAERDALKEELSATKDSLQNDVEKKMRAQKDISFQVEETIEQTEELQKIATRLLHEVGSATSALARYREGAQKLAEELLASENQRSLAESLLSRARADASEAEHRALLSEEQAKTVISEKESHLEEVEAELSAQIHASEENESAWAKTKRKSDALKRKLERELKEKDREISMLKLAQEELKAAQSQLKEAKALLHQETEEKEQIHTTAQNTARTLQGEASLARAQADSARRKAESLQGALVRAELSTANAFLRETAAKDASKALDDALLLSKDKERELFLQIRTLSLELSALKTLHS
ncbi:myosin heavy chain [Nematocida displodere]|uniref:Myosin heavy chain n=1 Tax=Nematocida displodere TaxID=1805483 RepID=A0A177EAV4_9MICR|nr:myosin heavy chain [Nematocida displodere]